MRGGGVFSGGGFRGGGGVFRGGGFRGSPFVHRPFFNSAFRFNRFNRFRSTTFFPFFYGGLGFYDSYPYSSYAYNPYAYAPSGYEYNTPPVIFNSDNYYGYSYPSAEPPAPPPAVVREYVQPPREPQKYEQPLYLVAFKDGVIRAVLAYWVEGATLHYVTMDHEQKQVSLSSVDRELSNRLNRERNVEFRLPQ